MKRVYIADDNVGFAEYVSIIADKNGWDAQICKNGQELIDSISKSYSDDPALLLIDINMPKMDGIETIDRLAILECPVRIRFMTGGQESSLLAARMIAEARDLQVGRNINKPLSKEKLTELFRDEAIKLSELDRSKIARLA